MKRRRLPPAADVLAGRAEVDLQSLVRLIHRVNPTARALPAAVVERRYAEKAGLQSLLIRRWPDQVSVRWHGGPETILLELLGADAGHSVLSALDDDARAWVRRRLDVDDPTSVAPAERPVADPGDYQSRAAHALAEYDFEAAEAHLSAAIAAAPGDRGPVAELLTLWVDTLGTDDRALALAEHLPGRLQNDGAVRGLLALAAARSGRLREAQRWVEGLAGPRAGDTWAALARAAVRADDLRAARRALSTLGRVHPSAPRLPALQDEVALLAARLRAPAEAALTTQFAKGPPYEAASAMADRLLEAHPDSPTAGRVLRQIADRRLEQRLDGLRAEAGAAVKAGRFGRAASVLREALELGAPVAEELARVSARADADRREARVDAVRDALAAPDEEALLAWWALAPAERVLASAPLPELVWLQQLAPSSGGARQAVRAVRALARAHAVVAENPNTALALVDPYRDLLASVPDAARLMALGDEAAALGRVARDRARLEAAEALIASGDAEAALLRLEPVGAEALSADEQRRVRVVQRHAELRRALAKARGPVERRPLLAALSQADLRWRQELEATDVEIRRQWGLRVWRDLGAPPAMLFAAGTRVDARVWMVPGQPRIVLPDLHGRWLFLRWIHADRVERAVCWRLPRAARLLDFVVEADALRLLTDDRTVYRFAADGRTVLGARRLPTGGAEAGVLVPGTPHAWLADQTGIDVVSVESGAVIRRLATGGLPGLGTVSGRLGPRITVRAEGISVRTPGGSLVQALDAPVEGVIRGAAGWVPVSPGPVGTGPWIDTHGTRLGHAAGRADGASFQLRSIHLWCGDLDWTCNVPAESVLVRDAVDGAVGVLVPDPRGLRARVLEAGGPPQLDVTPLWRLGEEVQPWATAARTQPPPGRLPAVHAARAAFTGTSPLQWLVDQRPHLGVWADAACCWALAPVDPGAAATVAETAARAWPRSGLAGLLAATRAIEDGRWAGVRALLEPRTPELEVAGRFHRVLGLARLHTGAPGGAAEAWVAGAKVAPGWRGEFAAAVAAVTPALEDGPALNAASVYGAFIRALRRAEAARCTGDLPGVVAALDQPWTWHFGEVQTLARLVEALLESPADEPASDLRHWHALAVFAAAAEGGLDLGPERRVVLPLAAERWTATRIEAVAERARRWLADQP